MTVRTVVNGVLETARAELAAQLTKMQQRTDAGHTQNILRSAINKALETITSPDASLEEKNNAARQILGKCVFDKEAYTLSISYRVTL